MSVLIPEDYYAKALELEKAAQGQAKSGGTGKTIEKIKEETEQAVKNIVAGAIPTDPVNPNPKQITVSSYVRIKEAPPEIRTSSLETVTSLFSQWGSAVGLGALRPVGLVDAAGHDAEGGVAPKRLPPEAAGSRRRRGPPATDEPKRRNRPWRKNRCPRLNDRDLVQTMVRDNPEMAVAIIGKWLQATR